MSTLKTLQKHSQAAADRWSRELLGEEHDAAIEGWARAAFLLYAIEWDGATDRGGRAILSWSWPFDALAEAKSGTNERPSRPFDGSQPWAVLLARCVDYTIPRRTT